MAASHTPLDTPLRSLVGAKTADGLESDLGLRTAGDLLGHYPRRYNPRGELTDLAGLAEGEHVTVLAEILKAHVRPMRQRRGTILEVLVGDRHRTLTLTFFNPRWRAKDLQVGRTALFAGKVGSYKGHLQLVHPQYQLVNERGAAADSVDPSAFAGALIPVYAATADVPSWKVGLAVRTVLDVLGPLPDPLAASLRLRYRLMPLRDALHAVHRPDTAEEAEAARLRLKWDEAMALQCALAIRRAGALRTPATPRPSREGGLLTAFDASLPYTLTQGQLDVGRQVAADLALDHPMHRLLSGEVGSGKTVVALRAMLQVVDTGGQAVLLAPTEVLASQHLRSLRDLLGTSGTAGELDAADAATRVVLLTGGLASTARRDALAAVADGSAGIVVGTHALLEEGVAFADLGLVVVDEQHRFGVEQRDALRSRGRAGAAPHVLVMTATPIPRTVAMTVFGDLETSTLTELPLGRQPITSHVVPDRRADWVERMWQRVRDEVVAGHQAFVVCPRISASEGESDTDSSDPADEPARVPAAVTELMPQLVEGPLAGLRVGMLHGRLASDEKDETMRRFARGDIDVLVATTVVEVGVDVPNATAMVVLDADRFGVSQLHQLRGRVGRGSQPSVALLHTAAAEDSPAAGRVAAVAATTDGAELALLDLATRREGDVLGVVQAGRRSRLVLLRLLEDEDIVVAARSEAQALVDDDVDLAKHPALRAAVDALVDDAAYLEKG